MSQSLQTIHTLADAFREAREQRDRAEGECRRLKRELELHADTDPHPALAGVRKERDDAVLQRDSAAREGAEWKRLHDQAVEQLADLARRSEEDMQALRNGLTKAIDRRDAEVARLREQVTRALDRIRFVDRAGADVAIRDAREILEGRPPPMLDAEDEAALARGHAIMRDRDERMATDFPTVVVGGRRHEHAAAPGARRIGDVVDQAHVDRLLPGAPGAGRGGRHEAPAKAGSVGPPA